MDCFVVRSSGPQEPTAKRCLDEPQSDTSKRPKFSDKDYDANKRLWKFQESWKVTFPWLTHEADDDDQKPGLMFCSTCRAYPELADKSSALYVGCSNMRVDPLKKHEFSAAHIKATHKKTKDTMTMKERGELATNSPIVKATKRCMQITMNMVVVMFNTVYSLAKKCKPLSDFETHMELHVKNKKDIGGDYMDIGTNFHNEKSAKQFLMSIAEQLRVTKTRLIEKVRFLTVLADGSTDFSMTEQYTV